MGKDDAGDFFNGRLQNRLRAFRAIKFQANAPWDASRDFDDTFLPGKRGVVPCREQAGQVLGPEWQALPLRILSHIWPVP